MGMTLYHYHLREIHADERENRQQALMKGSRDIDFVHDDTLLLQDLDEAVTSVLDATLIAPVRCFSMIASLIALPQQAHDSSLEGRIRESRRTPVHILTGFPDTLDPEVETLRRTQQWELLEEKWHPIPFDAPRYWERNVFGAIDAPGFYYDTVGTFRKILDPSYIDALPISWSGRDFADIGPVLRAEEHVFPDHRDAYRSLFIENHVPGRSLYHFYW